MRITKEQIFKASNNGSWKKAQLEILGISWPPKAGWINKLIYQEFDINTINEFVNFYSSLKEKKVSQIKKDNQLKLF